MTNQPKQNTFFDSGLRFECTNCGQCCTGAPGDIRVNDDELAALANFRNMTRDTFEREYTRPMTGGSTSLRERDDGTCIFFAENKCTVYSARPAQCRTYPFWLKNLRTPEAWNRAARQCPGIGRGPLHNRESILAAVRESSL